MAVAGIAAVIRRREAIRIVIARALCARGNLGKAVTISPRVPCYRLWYREIAVASLLAMTIRERLPFNRPVSLGSAQPGPAVPPPLQRAIDVHAKIYKLQRFLKICRKLLHPALVKRRGQAPVLQHGEERRLRRGIQQVAEGFRPAPGVSCSSW